MKKLAFVLLAAIISSSAMCSEPAESWIKTDDGQTQCEKVIVHKDYLIMTCTDGKQQNIPLSEVTSYSKKGKVYIKQAIFTEKYYQKDIKKSEVFLKLIASKDDMDLLSYKDSKNGTREFVFRGDQLVQELNQANRKEFHEFFGV